MFSSAMMLLDKVPDEIQESIRQNQEIKRDFEPSLTFAYTQIVYSTGGETLYSFSDSCSVEEKKLKIEDGCGWEEVQQITFENGKFTGKAKIPLASEIYTFKFDTTYSLLSILYAYLNENYDTYSKLSVTDMMLMEASSAVQSLMTATTALIAISAF